jgi:hypothetical protein
MIHFGAEQYSYFIGGQINMKYINAKKKKLERIRKGIQLEIKVGKCDQKDIDDILNFLKITLVPHDQTGGDDLEPLDWKNENGDLRAV